MDIAEQLDAMKQGNYYSVRNCQNAVTSCKTDKTRIETSDNDITGKYSTCDISPKLRKRNNG